jgi:hypothetical protein
MRVLLLQFHSSADVGVYGELFTTCFVFVELMSVDRVRGFPLPTFLPLFLIPYRKRERERKGGIGKERWRYKLQELEN